MRLIEIIPDGNLGLRITGFFATNSQFPLSTTDYLVLIMWHFKICATSLIEKFPQDMILVL